MVSSQAYCGETQQSQLGQLSRVESQPELDDDVEEFHPELPQSTNSTSSFFTNHFASLSFDV
ncbi:MAG: hypothetical protein LBU14_02465 [Candidatus Peribacteria bacterium]|nr:hypothetical protein [Candidatus Peribacteria bacterium]